MKPNILIVEDEEALTEVLRYNLEAEGYEVETVARGDEADVRLKERVPDLVLLDWMLPGPIGIVLAGRVRSASDAAVVMMTARDELDERLRGFAEGADDYVVKPFAFAELLARLRALVRRGDPERPSVLEVGELRLDPATRRVWRDDTEIKLSTKEFAVLETFMRRPDEVLSRLHLLEHAWDFAYDNKSNIVDVYVRYLRDKYGEIYALPTDDFSGAGTIRM